MSKIYSRPRIRITKRSRGKTTFRDINTIKNSSNSKNLDRFRSLKNKNKSRLLCIIAILIIAFATVRVILNAVYPIFDALCEAKAKSIATTISNKEATNVMKEHTYEDMFTIEKDTSGNITMIKSNMVAINQIISDVAIRIQEDLDNSKRENIEIASGSFTGFKLLAGRGPGVRIRISPVGTVETDLKSEFIEQGVNQTLHRAYLEVRVNVDILTPFQNSQKEITNQVLLAENIIVGRIPQNYYNFEGNNDSSTALELVE